MLRAQKVAQKPYKHVTLAQTDSKVAKPFKAISDKQAKRLAKYRVVRDEYFKTHPICEYPGCNEINNLDLHHMKGRTGDLLTDVRYFKALCRKHHRWVEENVNEAIEMGLSAKRLDL